MLLTTLHALACLALIGAAVGWRMRHGKSTTAHRFLFPYIIATGIAAILLLGEPLVEIFIACYSGATFTIRMRYTGPYAWVFLAGGFLPFLPALGILPTLGKRPVVMASLGLLALLPALFGYVFR